LHFDTATHLVIVIWIWIHTHWRLRVIHIWYISLESDRILRQPIALIHHLWIRIILICHELRISYHWIHHWVYLINHRIHHHWIWVLHLIKYIIFLIFLLLLDDLLLLLLRRRKILIELNPC